MIRIYTLTDPRTNQVFYVGASKSTDMFIIGRHLMEFKGVRGELRELKLRPILETLDTTDDTMEAGVLETYWIWQFRAWGFQLENKRLLSGYEGSSNAKYSKNWMIAERERRSANRDHHTSC